MPPFGLCRICDRAADSEFAGQRICRRRFDNDRRILRAMQWLRTRIRAIVSAQATHTSL